MGRLFLQVLSTQCPMCPGMDEIRGPLSTAEPLGPSEFQDTIKPDQAAAEPNLSAAPISQGARNPYLEAQFQCGIRYTPRCPDTTEMCLSLAGSSSARPRPPVQHRVTRVFLPQMPPGLEAAESTPSPSPRCLLTPKISQDLPFPGLFWNLGIEDSKR